MYACACSGRREGKHIYFKKECYCNLLQGAALILNINMKLSVHNPHALHNTTTTPLHKKFIKQFIKFEVALFLFLKKYNIVLQ